MAIGAVTASEGTGRSSINSKPFFSRTRRDATLAASGSATTPAEGSIPRTSETRTAIELGAPARGDPRRLTDRVVDADVPDRRPDRDRMVGVVVAPIPLAPADG